MSIQQGNVGLVFTLTINDSAGGALDLTNATAQSIILKPPTGVAITRTASVVAPASNGQVRYTTVAGDLGMPGKWKVQAMVTMSGGQVWYSSTASFTVEANL